MTAIDTNISAAFRGGEIRTRELRLTEGEADYVRAHYAAVVRDMGENWYEITFTGSVA